MQFKATPGLHVAQGSTYYTVMVAHVSQSDSAVTLSCKMWHFKHDSLYTYGSRGVSGRSMASKPLQGRAADVPKSSRLPGKAETNMAKTLSAKSWKKHVWMFGPAMPEPQQQTSDSTPQQQFPAAPQAASRDPPQASQGSGDPQQLPGGTQHTDGDPPAVGEGPEQASMELAEKQADAPMVSITPVVERYLQVPHQLLCCL